MGLGMVGSPQLAAAKRKGKAMVGRHRRQVRAMQARIQEQRPGIEVVDSLTQVTHRVTGDALLAGRLAGQYKALCGVRLLAASLTDPGRGLCTACVR
jgi:hypothetical protein